MAAEGSGAPGRRASPASGREDARTASRGPAGDGHPEALPGRRWSGAPGTRLRPVWIAVAIALAASWGAWAFSVLAQLGCATPLGFCPLAP